MSSFVPVNISPLINTSLINNTISTFVSQINTSLPENSPQCCAFGDCRSCTDKVNKNPILFIHGHSFNEENSPEISLESFAKMQKELEQYGYVNGGRLIPAEITQRINFPVSMRGTYYQIVSFDVGKYSLITQKSDKIENYALRLKELMDAYKANTDAERVDIVAHSMGGLVVREYIRIFGDQDVGKLVMIGTPNNGVSKGSTRLCVLFGSSRECEDMEKGSLFMKRLGSANIPSVEVYNIIGTGCGDDMKSDGVVNTEDVELDYARNIYVEGDCTSRNLHNKLIDPKAQKKVLGVIGEILSG